MYKTIPAIRQGSEEELQRQCVAYLKNEYPLVAHQLGWQGARLSGGARSWQRFCLMGASAGAPDLFIYEPCMDYHGFAVEFKVKGGVVSVSQKKWLIALEARNYVVCVVWSLAEFQCIFSKYASEDRSVVSLARRSLEQAGVYDSKALEVLSAEACAWCSNVGIARSHASLADKDPTCESEVIVLE